MLGRDESRHISCKYEGRESECPKNCEKCAISIKTEGFPYCMIWQNTAGKPSFVCIEPWYGRCDHVDFSGELKDREYTNLLASGESFHAEYIMRFN